MGYRSKTKKWLIVSTGICGCCDICTTHMEGLLLPLACMLLLQPLFGVLLHTQQVPDDSPFRVVYMGQDDVMLIWPKTGKYEVHGLSRKSISLCSDPLLRPAKCSGTWPLSNSHKWAFIPGEIASTLEYDQQSGRFRIISCDWTSSNRPGGEYVDPVLNITVRVCEVRAAGRWQLQGNGTRDVLFVSESVQLEWQPT